MLILLGLARNVSLMLVSGDLSSGRLLSVDPGCGGGGVWRGLGFSVVTLGCDIAYILRQYWSEFKLAINVV